MTNNVMLLSNMLARQHVAELKFKQKKLVENRKFATLNNYFSTRSH